MKNVLQGCVGLVVIGLVLLIVAAVIRAATGVTDSDAEGAAIPRPTLQPTATPSGAVNAGTQALAATASPLPSPAPTATPTSVPTRRPTPTPTPVVTYAACDNVPTYLLRLDTQGRVAVQRELVPSQPDGDDDGFACGDQLEHKRSLVRYTPASARTPPRTARPQSPATECPTAPEAQYLSDLGDLVSVMRNSTGEINDLLNLAAENVMLTFTDEFQAAFVVHAAIVTVGAEAVLDLNPPSARLRTVDRASKRMARSSIATAEGIGAADVERLNEGARLFRETAGHAQAANRAITQLCA